MEFKSQKSTYEECKDMLSEWSESIQYGLDGFYEDMCIFHPDVVFFEIQESKTSEKIGFFSIQTKETVVTTFFILRNAQGKVDPKDVFQKLVVDALKIKAAYACSLDTYFFNALLDHQKEVAALGYAPFICDRKEERIITHPLDFKDFIMATEKDGDMMWDIIKGEKMFLESKEKMKEMILKKQLLLFYLKEDENNETLMAVGVRCESKVGVFKKFWNIGMFVNPKFRRQGIGSYVLNTLQNFCIRNGKIPIGGCARPNVASRKTMQKSGMINRGSFLYVRLSE